MKTITMRIRRSLTQWLIRRAARRGFNDRNGRYQFDYREVSVRGTSYFLPEYGAHLDTVKRMRRGQMNEPRTQSLIQTIFAACDGSMIHAHAFFGEMLPPFSQAVGGTLWCFEPVTENYVLANKCLARNDCENVILLHATLSDRTAMIAVDTGAEAFAGGHLHRGGAPLLGGDGTPAPALAIDQLECVALQVIHLKMGGQEAQALAGARATIQMHAPLILVEESTEQCAALLKGMGYQLHGVTPELWLWVSDRRPDHQRLLDEWITTKNKRAAFGRK